MLVATRIAKTKCLDATGLSRGASRLLLLASNVKPPRHKAVASSLKELRDQCSDQRESPRDKPVAS